MNSRRRKKKASIAMESIRQERKYLLNKQSDFYTREAYKSLRTNVMFSLTGESKNNVILVASSMPGEGKSISAANLAASFAQAGKRTLLIDCDMRKPKLASLMNLQSSVGLSNIILRPEQYKSAIVQTKRQNLWAVTAGDIPPNPSELLGSRLMQELIRELRTYFEYIILDTPPVNVVTDAVVLSPVADGILFVVKAGQSERGAVRRAIDQLTRVNVKLLGFVLNGADKLNSSYGKYRGSAYSHKYYQESYGYGYADTPEEKKISAGGEGNP